MKKISLTAGLIAGLLTAAAPAQAALPIYGAPGTENPVNYSFVAGNTGQLRAWFTGASAGYTSFLGAIVGGVDRGLGFSNQGTALGQLHNFGAITAGQSIQFYIFVQNTGETFTNNGVNNPDGVQHVFFAQPYTGGDFGIPLSPSTPGSYFGFEDLTGGGDFDYNDFTFVARTGGIPEPATWAFMILGFGLIGGAMRQTKSRQSVRVRFA